MKSCVIIYHKNVENIYKFEWIRQCVRSIENQDYKQFDIFELNYGNEDKFYSKGFHLKADFSNHIHAMNYLIDHVLGLGYDVIFNTNLDDWYAPNRFGRQINAIKDGAELVSSNFYYYNDDIGDFRSMNMKRYDNIGLQLRKNHNVIAHPVVAWHKSFFKEGLRYEDKLGFEDLLLWQKAFLLQKKMIILPDYLLHYRLHDEQVTKKYKGL